MPLEVTFLLVFGCFCCKSIAVPQKDKIYVTKGAEVILNCSNKTVNGIRWSRMLYGNHSRNFTVYTDGTSINPDIENKDRFKIIINKSGGKYQLKIRNISEYDEGEYRCSYFQDNIFSAYDVSLRITKYPSNIRFLNEYKAYISGKEGSELTISCLVDSGDPPETLSLQSTDGLYIVGGPGRINHSLRLTYHSPRINFTCKAINRHMTVPLISKVQLVVKYKPRVRLSEGTQLTLKEGGPLDLTCNFSCYPNQHNISWYHPSYDVDESINIFRDLRMLEIYPVTKTHTGTFTCKVINEVGTGTARIYITVQYPPVVNIKVSRMDNIFKLDCIPKGLPNIYTFEPWEHTSNTGQHIRFLNGDQNGSLILNQTKQESILQDTGIYICSVSNGITDRNDKLRQTKHTAISCKGPPIFGNKIQAVKYGTFAQTTILNFEVYSLEEVDMVIKDGFNQQKFVVSEIKEQNNISVVIHGRNIYVEGFNIKIKTKPLTGEDFGNYTATAVSRFGNTTYHFTLKSASLPLSPYNVTLATTATKIFVRWNRNFNGGYQQEFYIELFTKDMVQLSNYGPLADTMQGQQLFTLYSMTPGTSYYVRMFSKNKLGHSNFTEVLEVTTIDTSRLSGAYVSAILCAVCILTIFTVAVFHKKWKAKRNLNHEDEDEVIHPLGNQHHVDNVLYQSQEEINLSGGGGGDGYSTIDRSDAIPPYGAVVSYSAQCTDSDEEDDYENVTGKKCKFLNKAEHNDISIKNDHVLNYSEIVFSPCESPRFVIHGSNNKTVYADVDLSVKSVALPYTDDESSDDNTSDFDDVSSWVKTKDESD
ncbi:protein turtle homolog B-like [Mytilus edulis]|uniref:protein turtle homolog B-like n=1 Tax=Mytilus edulis TaxID=6550 RepID=UPI0039EF4F78